MHGLKKFAIFCHRWTGSAFCVLFCWWFVSGIFMMYVDYPEVNDSDRLAHAQPHRSHRAFNSRRRRRGQASRPKASPMKCACGCSMDAPRIGSGWEKPAPCVYADNGQTQTKFPSGSESPHRGRMDRTARRPRRSRGDDIRRSVDRRRPLLQLRTAHKIFVARWRSRSTSRARPAKWCNTPRAASRFLAYLGPIPHWLYFTPLRKNPRLWSRIVIWLSGIATAVALLGLFAGLSLYSPVETDSRSRERSVCT